MKVSRRHVLKGIGGAVLALPVLESFAPRRSSAQDTSLTYAIFFRQANGVGCAQDTSEIGMEPERFWPMQEGLLSDATMTGRAVDELLAYRSRLLLVGNVNMEEFPYGDGHARGAMQGLTAQGPVVASAGGDSEANGESIDHRIGTALNADGRESLFLYAGASGGWLGGACISYRSAGVRRAAYENPKAAYDAIVGIGSGLSPEAAQQLANRQMSINDLVRTQMTRLMQSPKLSSSDRDRLQLHFDSIRDLETQITCSLSQAEVAALDGAAAFYDSGDGDDVWATARMHMDIAAMAVACGYTRSVAIQIGNGNDGNNRYVDPDSGQVMENYHYISHRRLSHDSNGAVIPNSDILHHKVDRQFAQQFKYLLDKLDAYVMPDGQPLLNHGVSVWYNDNGNGPGHARWNVPYILAGSANGVLKQGEYLRLPGSDPYSDPSNHAKMLNTIATAVGVTKADGNPLDDFGDPSLEGGLHSELLV